VIRCAVLFCALAASARGFATFATLATPAAQAAAGGAAQGVARVNALYDQNRFAETAQLGEQLVKANRESAEAWFALARVHLSTEWTMRRDARAESAMRNVLRIDGRKPDTVRWIATAQFRQARYEECLPLLNELVDADPPRLSGDPFAQMLMLRASVRLRRDALDAEARAAARRDLDRALAAVPNHGPSRALRSEMLFDDGKAAEALADLEVALRALPGDKGVHYQLQACLTRLKRREEADRHREIWRILNRLTDSVASANAPDAATRRALLQKLKELNPDDLARRLELCESEISAGEIDAALAECDALLERKRGWPAAQHLRDEALRAKAGARPNLPNAVPAHGKDGGGE